MSLENDLQALTVAHEQLREQLSALRMTVVEDRPLSLDLALIDDRGDTLDELLGLSEAGLRAAQRALQAARPPIDWVALQIALLSCDMDHSKLMQRLWSELLRYEKVTEIVDAGRRHGGEWIPWASGVLAGLDDCPRAAHAVRDAFIECWRALLERADPSQRGFPSISTTSWQATSTSR